MALSFKRAAVPASRVSGRRVAVAARVPASRVQLNKSFVDCSIDLTPVSVRATGRSRVVVEAVKKSVGDLQKADLEGKRVFVRADLNVPLDKQFNITDDTRIRGAVPTLKYLLDNGAKVLLTSHLVRCLSKYCRIDFD